MRRDDPDQVATVVDLTRAHLARRPVDNPITRMAARVGADLPWLATQGIEAFHHYAFGLCRQCGASTELASTFVDWLNEHDGPGTESAAADLRQVAEGSKSLQFALARAARGRTVNFGGVFDDMAASWDRAMDVLGRALWRLTGHRTVDALAGAGVVVRLVAVRGLVGSGRPRRAGPWPGSPPRSRGRWPAPSAGWVPPTCPTSASTTRTGGTGAASPVPPHPTPPTGGSWSARDWPRWPTCG